MLKTVRNRSVKGPKGVYSVMACDRCEAECPESKQTGRTIRASQDAAILAVRTVPGWTEVFTPDRSRRRAIGTIELLCPTCSAAAPVHPATVQVTDDDGEAD